ncbi:histidine acid phosphatase [Achlya hypogyna]|uniref:Histidine acid phosphatase n=1 Tax=Achlya hypogyna TaxID=1202772 RepID=A0A1V9YNM8_ACHHY|nr:histidine acid phosphatase [Achlya hypogyna]
MVTTRSGRSPVAATTPTKKTRASPKAPKAEDLELVHVMMLFRHGDRSPITTKVGEHLVMDEAEKEFWISKLPTDDTIAKLGKIAKVTGMETHLPPPKDPRDGGVYPNGQLTQWGLDQMEAKGRKLRGHYAAFLDGIDAGDVYIRSTNVRRTIRSCQSLLHGLLPEFVPAETDAEPKLHIRTATVVSLEPTFTQAEYGSRLARYKDKALAASLPPLPSHLGDMDAVDAQVRAAIGIAPDDHICYTSLREVLVCRNAHKVPFPNAMPQEVYDKIVDYNTWEFHTLFGNAAECHEGFSRGIREIADLLHSVVHGNKAPKLTLLAVHDSSLIAFWNAFQLVVGNVFPLYAAATVVEVYKKPGTAEFFVQIKLDGDNALCFRGTKAPLVPFARIESIVAEFFAHGTSDDAPDAKKPKTA